MKLTSAHVLISSFAAVAGVAIAGYQAFAPQREAPLQVSVSVDPNADQAVAKSDSEPVLQTASIDLTKDASFVAAFKDGSETRYSFAEIFDGNPATFLTVKAPDREINVLVTFGGAKPERVTAIEYAPPPGAGTADMASTVDVMILPEGRIEASGLPVMSFTLQQTPGSQVFSIPGDTLGKGIWLRVAGSGLNDKVKVGDFRVIHESLAP